MIKSLLLLPVLLLAGCASSELSGNDFVKAGVSSQQKMSDATVCTSYANANRGPATVSGPEGEAEVAERRDDLFRMCMVDRGYRPL